MFRDINCVVDVANLRIFEARGIVVLYLGMRRGRRNDRSIGQLPRGGRMAKKKNFTETGSIWMQGERSWKKLKKCQVYIRWNFNVCKINTNNCTYLMYSSYTLYLPYVFKLYIVKMKLRTF